MKKLIYAFGLWAVASWCVTGCDNRGQKSAGDDSANVLTDTVADSTVYGVCGEGSAMSTVELVTDAGDTLTYLVDEDDSSRQCVQGGLLVGDRLAVIGSMGPDGERVAQKVINLTTLQGKWTSLDKNFEILEGGVVKSNVAAESHPWTAWKILNGRLLLNQDTFSIDCLGADSLYLENNDGIFVFKRQK